VLGVEVTERVASVKGFFVESSGAGLPITIKLKSRSGKSITARATEMDSLRYGSRPWENPATLLEERVKGVRTGDCSGNSP